MWQGRYQRQEEGVRSPFSRMVWNSQSLKAEAGIGVLQAREAEQAWGEGAENELLALLGLLDALIMARYSGAAGEITSSLLGPDTWKQPVKGGWAYFAWVLRDAVCPEN